MFSSRGRRNVFGYVAPSLVFQNLALNADQRQGHPKTGRARLALERRTRHESLIAKCELGH